MTRIDYPEGDQPSLGVDAVMLRRLDDVETRENEHISYDRHIEAAWIQSDVSYPREVCV